MAQPWAIGDSTESRVFVCPIIRSYDSLSSHSVQLEIRHATWNQLLGARRRRRDRGAPLLLRRFCGQTRLAL